MEELAAPSWFRELFPMLLERVDLDPGLVTEAFRELLSGVVPDGVASAFLVALRMKGESAGEIAGAAIALREQMIQLVPVTAPVVDTCGTGGDSLGTFNISTAAALVTAACGVPVVKHGNRAVSSRSGSADVLRELGVPIEAGPVWAQKCLERIGFAFCYAPQFHRGMAHVGQLRRLLGVRTIFNLLGPLANPASADFQLLGVGSPALLDPLAGAVARLGTRRAVLVSGHDGLDEVSLSSPTRVRIVEGKEYTVGEWQPSDFGLETVPLEAIKAEGPVESAEMIRRILGGEQIPAADVVFANAATVLWLAGRVDRLPEGVELAREAVNSGRAADLLAELCKIG